MPNHKLQQLIDRFFEQSKTDDWYLPEMNGEGWSIELATEEAKTVIASFITLPNFDGGSSQSVAASDLVANLRSEWIYGASKGDFPIDITVLRAHIDVVFAQTKLIKEFQYPTPPYPDGPTWKGAYAHAQAKLVIDALVFDSPLEAEYVHHRITHDLYETLSSIWDVENQWFIQT